MEQNHTVNPPEDGSEPPASAIIEPRKKHVFVFIGILSVLSIVLGYYDLFVLRPSRPTPNIPSKDTFKKSSSIDWDEWELISSQHKQQWDGGVDSGTPDIAGVNIGGLMNVERESRLMTTLRNSMITKVVHVIVLLVFLLSILSFALRLGYLIFYSDLLKPSWITITYGAVHLFFSIMAIINWAIVGHSFFTNQNHDLYSKIGKWAPTIINVIVTAFFMVDMAMYIFPEQLKILSLEGFFETVTTLIGQNADFPEWFQAVMQDGHNINPIGVCSNLFGALVTASFALNLAIQLASSVHTSVQVLAVVITITSAIMSMIYSIFKMILPSRSVSMTIQILYLVVAIGGIVYGLKGSIWSWSSLVTLILMISQLKTCLNLGFTNSSLFWTLISPFYVVELYV